MSLATFLRRTANALSSFLFAAVAAAQTVHGSPAQPSTYPNSATEKAVQVINVGALTQVNCTINLTWLGCSGGPFTDGNMVINGSSIAAGAVIGAPFGGAAAVPGVVSDVPHVFCKFTSGTDINTSTTETTFASCSIPAGVLSSSSIIRFVVIGDYLWNNNVADTFRIKVKYGCPSTAAACAGGQVMYDNGTTAALITLDNTLSATRHATRLVVEMMALGATNSQGCNMQLLSGSRDTTTGGTGTSQFGLGGGSPQPAARSVNCATTTVDDTVTSFLILTGTMGTSSASDSWRSLYGYAEFVP